MATPETASAGVHAKKPATDVGTGELCEDGVVEAVVKGLAGGKGVCGLHRQGCCENVRDRAAGLSNFAATRAVVPTARADVNGEQSTAGRDARKGAARQPGRIRAHIVLCAERPMCRPDGRGLARPMD